jgi:transcriptional antiterminator RfaH
MGKGFSAYLPLHLERWTSRPSEASVVPLFRGYVFVQFDPFRDQWRRIYRARGIAGLIGVTTDRPAPLGNGIIDELISRASPRRIVDDPGSASFPDPAASRQHWQNLTALSG